jgi:hypothetical protein
MPKVLVAILAALVMAPATGWSQSPYPLRGDVETLDGIIDAYYEVVSGPAGVPRQWERDHSLHIPYAQVVVVRNDSSGTPVGRAITLGEFHEASAGIEESGFFETEIHRITERHGAVAHVWSTYEWRIEKEGPVGGRGVNTIQLYYDGERWWITSWMFDGRSDAPPVPTEYLPEGGG